MNECSLEEKAALAKRKSLKEKVGTRRKRRAPPRTKARFHAHASLPTDPSAGKLEEIRQRRISQRRVIKKKQNLPATTLGK